VKRARRASVALATALAVGLAGAIAWSVLRGAPASGGGAPAPDPARLEGEVRAFEERDAESPPPADAILALGSSSVRFWHATIREDLAPLPIVPRGFGGSTMSDALHFVDRLVVPVRPRAILLYEGDNDIEMGMSPGRVVDDFRKLVAAVRAHRPDTRFYVMSIKPSPARWSVWPAMREANRRLERECAVDSGLVWIDVAGPMLGDDGRPRPEIFLPDSLHLDALGYEVWTAAVRPVLLAGEAGR
jgi:lysophospholipase L1-like esterase